MKVLVTGAAGVLGSGVVEELVAAGHTVRAVDLLPLPAGVAAAPGVESVQLNLADAAQARAAVEGIEVVVHCASIHPWKPYTDDQYWDLNVKGTHHLLGACVAAGVQKVVLTSSVEPWSSLGREAARLPLREERWPEPRRLYALTKWVGEEIAQRFWRVDRLPALVLRPATFIPRDEWQAGLGLLRGTWLYPADVIHAHALAVAAPAPTEGVEACFIAPAVPYTPEEVVAGRLGPEQALAVYERHFPGVGDLLRRQGTPAPTLGAVYAIDRARRLLGWAPCRSFAEWFAQYRDHPPPAVR